MITNIRSRVFSGYVFLNDGFGVATSHRTWDSILATDMMFSGGLYMYIQVATDILVDYTR